MKATKTIKHEFEICHISPFGEKYILRGAFADKAKTKMYFGILNVKQNTTLTVEIPIDFGRGHFVDKKVEREMTKYYNDPSNVNNETLAQYLNKLLLVGLVKKYHS